jgi:hypothetical protein
LTPKDGIVGSIERKAVVMPWDEELEELTTQVFDILGESALNEAVGRATTRVLARDGGTQQVTKSVDDEHPSDSRMMRLSDGTIMSADAVYEVLKLELRRLVRPH